jgi:hypothetical protein
MNISNAKNFVMVTLVTLGLMTVSENSSALTCVVGSKVSKAPLYIVKSTGGSLDPSNFIMGGIVGSITKTAVFKSDCKNYTTYTISGTSKLPYPNGTVFKAIASLFTGARYNNFLATGADKNIYITVVNASVNSTFATGGASTGNNSPMYLESSVGMMYAAGFK